MGILYWGGYQLHDPPATIYFAVLLPRRFRAEATKSHHGNRESPKPCPNRPDGKLGSLHLALIGDMALSCLAGAFLFVRRQDGRADDSADGHEFHSHVTQHVTS